MIPCKYWVVIPAAGVGQRLGASIPKQYIPLHGKTMIEHVLAKFTDHPLIEKIVVVINEKDFFWPQLGLETSHPKIVSTIGAQQRCQSVLAGLTAIAPLASRDDFVLIHDANRPCVPLTDIDKLINSVKKHPVGGILGTRVCDTLKYVNNADEIINTMPRENIWQALTPQMFRFAILFQALQQMIDQNKSVTDEAGAMEAAGFSPVIVEGNRNNIKITYYEDLALAKSFLAE